MSFTRINAIFVFSLAYLLVSAAFGDQVVMKNGDRVTGVILKKDGKVLTIKTDQFGVVTAAWDQVESVKTDHPVTVVDTGGKTVQGRVTTADGKVEVATEAAPVSLAPADVKAIRGEAEQRTYERMLRPGLGELWAGSASLGFAGTNGNAKTLSFTTGVNADRVTNTDKISLYFNSIKASALVNGTSASTAQAIRGGIGYNRNLNSRWFVNLFNDYEYDKFQNLDLRFVLGSGLGFHAIKTERSQLDLLGGVDFNRSSYSTPATKKSAELYWGDDYSLKLSAATSLVQTFRMFHDVTDTGQFRANFDLGASTKISKWFSWNVSVSDRYLHHPALGRKTNDFLYTTGLGVSFAR